MHIHKITLTHAYTQDHMNTCINTRSQDHKITSRLPALKIKRSSLLGRVEKTRCKQTHTYTHAHTHTHIQYINHKTHRCWHLAIAHCDRRGLGWPLTRHGRRWGCVCGCPGTCSAAPPAAATANGVWVVAPLCVRGVRLKVVCDVGGSLKFCDGALQRGVCAGKEWVSFPDFLLCELCCVLVADAHIQSCTHLHTHTHIHTHTHNILPHANPQGLT